MNRLFISDLHLGKERPASSRAFMRFLATHTHPGDELYILGDLFEAWLGDGKWDVIHFNFGLHDAKYNSETTQRASREQYAANLKTLIALMKATGAKLIFATTTPVPMGGVLSPTRKFDSIEERNKLAVQLMQQEGVAVDDLYATVLPVQKEVGRPNDVHFGAEGYELLAKAVATSIETTLAKK